MMPPYVAHVSAYATPDSTMSPAQNSRRPMRTRGIRSVGRRETACTTRRPPSMTSIIMMVRSGGIRARAPITAVGT